MSLRAVGGGPSRRGATSYLAVYMSTFFDLTVERIGGCGRTVTVGRLRSSRLAYTRSSAAKCTAIGDAFRERPDRRFKLPLAAGARSLVELPYGCRRRVIAADLARSPRHHAVCGTLSPIPVSIAVSQMSGSSPVHLTAPLEPVGVVCPVCEDRRRGCVLLQFYSEVCPEGCTISVRVDARLSDASTRSCSRRLVDLLRMRWGLVGVCSDHADAFFYLPGPNHPRPNRLSFFLEHLEDPHPPVNGIALSRRVRV